MEGIKLTSKTVKISEYARASGKTRAQVLYACKNGELNAIRTEGGHWRIIIRDNYVPRSEY